MTTTTRRTALAVAALLCGVGALSLSAGVQAQRAEMPASTRLAMPGEKHLWLEPLVGKWNVQMRVWPTAGATPIESTRKRTLRFDIEIEIAGDGVNLQRIYVRYPGEPEFLFVEQRFTKAR